MKKITLLVAAVLVAATSWAQNPTISKVWEFSAAATSDVGGLPGYIKTSTADRCRGMAYGKIGTEKVLVVATRETANAVHVIDASNGTILRQLNISTLTGGTFTLNDVAISTDGKVLVCNLSAGTAGTFKVYKWDNILNTTVPTVAISFALSADASRFGDHFIVTGSLSAGTAKVYAASQLKVGGAGVNLNSQKILVWSMIEDTNNPGAYVFNQTPQEIFSIVNSGSAWNLPSVCPLPNGKLLYKANGSSMYVLNNDLTLEGTTVSTSVIDGSTNGYKFLKTRTGGVVDTTYLVGLRYSDNRAMLYKMPEYTYASMVSAGFSNSLGASGNANGTGRVCVQDDEEGTNVYVLATNLGIGKYSITWPSTPTSIISTTTSLKITKTSSLLKVEGATPVAIELFNTLGQKVQSVVNKNELNISNLRGVHIVKVNVNGKVSTQKVSI